MEALTDSGSDPLLSAALRSPMHNPILSMDDEVDDSCDDVDEVSPTSIHDNHFIDFAEDLVVSERKLAQHGRSTIRSGPLICE